MVLKHVFYTSHHISTSLEWTFQEGSGLWQVGLTDEVVRSEKAWSIWVGLQDAMDSLRSHTERRGPPLVLPNRHQCCGNHTL